MQAFPFALERLTIAYFKNQCSITSLLPPDVAFVYPTFAAVR